MTALDDARLHAPSRAPARRLVMCRPSHFAVSYRINPWMDPKVPVDRERAVEQWEHLVAVYGALGHQVDLMEPAPGLPDMVFAANSALVVDGRALLARFSHPQRRGEEAACQPWFEQQGFSAVRRSTSVMEGEGDVVVVGELLVAASGFRTERAAHAEMAQLFDREVLSVTLVDERFYHLDTAMFLVDGSRIAWFPGAFSEPSQHAIRRRFPDALVADERDALAMGLNAFSDGRHVVLSARAESFARRLEREGLEPVLVEMGELHRSGGSVKCCTLEVRS